MSRTFLALIVVLFFALGVAAVRAETFQLSDGATMSGTVASFDQNGLVLRDEAGNYSERISWSKLSQDDLKKLQQNPKMASFVEPFIEEQPGAAQPEIAVKPVTRLDRPGKISLLGAMVSSSVGLTVLLLVYAANIFAGYEIARFRQRPLAMVCGVSAALPVIGPIIFIALPTVSSEPEYVAPEVTASQQQTFTVAPVPGVPGESAAEPEQTQPTSSLHLSPGSHAQTGSVPQTQSFSRGQFMFNRRFFETKFPGFFGVVRRGSDKDMVLVFKTARGEYVGQRIARITGSELHLQVEQGDASAEVMVPFNDIKEIQLKHKDA